MAAIRTGAGWSRPPADRARRSSSIGPPLPSGPCRCSSQGVPHDERADEAAAAMQGDSVTVTVDLGTGGAHAATMWTCDFSAEYVRINAEYRT